MIPAEQDASGVPRARGRDLRLSQVLVGQPLKLCGKCDGDKPPEGGVQLNPQKWLCAGCWVAKQRRMGRS